MTVYRFESKRIGDRSQRPPSGEVWHFTQPAWSCCVISHSKLCEFTHPQWLSAANVDLTSASIGEAANAQGIRREAWSLFNLSDGVFHDSG